MIVLGKSIKDWSIQSHSIVLFFKFQACCGRFSFFKSKGNFLFYSYCNSSQRWFSILFSALSQFSCLMFCCTVMARFGLFKDAIEMKHSNRHLMKNREWRTSLINSFAAHLALVLFNCSDGHYITAYVQERPIKLPGCSSELCKYSDFRKQYETLAASCNIDDICRI